MVECAWVFVFLVLVRGSCCKRYCFLGNRSTPVLGDVGEWVSRVFKDQVFGLCSMFSLNWLFGFWTVDIASEILSFTSKCL